MIANDNMKSYIYKIRIYFLILIAFIYHSTAYSPELNIQYAEDLQSNLKKNLGFSQTGDFFFSSKMDRFI